MKKTFGILMVLCIFSLPGFASAMPPAAGENVATLQALVARLQALLAQLKALEDSKSVSPVTTEGLTIQYGDAVMGPAYSGAGFTEDQFVLVVDVTVWNTTGEEIEIEPGDFALGDSTHAHQFDILQDSDVGGQPRFAKKLVPPTVGRVGFREPITIADGKTILRSLEFYVPTPDVREFVISFEDSERSLVLTDETHHE